MLRLCDADGPIESVHAALDILVETQLAASLPLG